MSVISANKLSLQEFAQQIRIKLLISRFPENVPSQCQFPGGANARFAPPCGRPCLQGCNMNAKGQTWNENIWTVTRSKETSPS